MKQLLVFSFLLSFSITTKLMAKTFYLADHGIHTAFVIDVRDIPGHLIPERHLFPRAHYLEISIGEEPFFRSKNHSRMDVVKALFWPTPNLIRLIGLPADIERAYAKLGLIRFEVDENKLLKLLNFLHGSFKRQGDDMAKTVEDRQADGEVFLEAVGNYHILNTCNNWTADGLDQVDISVPMYTWFSSNWLYQKAANQGEVVSLPESVKEDTSPVADGLKRIFSK